MPNRFCRYQLRSLDVDSALAFYRHVFGHDFWGNGIDIAPLPAAAAARGVPGYWLGHVGVEDVVPSMYSFLEAGAKRLGPPPPDGRDDAGVVLNDPFGAKLALTPATESPATDRDTARASGSWRAGAACDVCLERHARTGRQHQ
jgi:hypothetical protein